MESINQFILNLSEENLQKLPVSVYGIKEMPVAEMKLVTNSINNTSQYPCGHYYKPITQIIDTAALRLTHSEKD